MKTTLRDWLMQLAERFDARELDYMSAHAAVIRLQLKDQEIACLHLHEITFTSQDAQQVVLVK